MAAKEKISFEKALAKLETIVEKLEGESLTLDESLAQFEQGVQMVRMCDAHLKNAEGKISELLEKEDSTLVEKMLGSTVQAISNDNQEVDDD